MLEVSDPRGKPFAVQRRLMRISIQEAYGSAAIEERLPHGRARIPLSSELREDGVAVRGAGDENAIRPSDHIGHRRRCIHPHERRLYPGRAEALAEQDELRAPIRRKL